MKKLVFLKKINKKRLLSNLLTLALLVLPLLAYCQIEGAIETWKGTARTVGKSVIGLAAIGGGVITYFKMQSDDGSAGKKALMGYIGALIFGAVVWMVIDSILK